MDICMMYVVNMPSNRPLRPLYLPKWLYKCSFGCANCSPLPRECSYFNSPCFVVSCSFQIRVVNAFRQGLDARYGEHSNTSLAEVLRKQTSLSKRLSQTSSIEYADNIPDELTIPEIDVERLSSHSHTETAV